MQKIMQKNWYQKKWVVVVAHIVTWVVVFSLPWLMRLAYDNNMPKNPDNNGMTYLNLLTDVLWAGLFYLNAYALFPKFVTKKNYSLYALVLLGIFFIIMLIHGFIFKTLVTSRPFIFMLSAVFNSPAFLLTVASSMIFRFVKDKRRLDAIAQQKHEENLKTELSFLRSQISPHFIFNILNNLVALARIKSEQLEPTIIKLSSLMQYMLYETNEEKVLLHTEVEYLHAYIDLQQQRFGNKVQIKTDIDIADEFYLIEPMLLIPFVENAFKHGVGMIENAVIDIQMKTIHGQLQFNVRNKFNSDRSEIKDKVSGIGLANVKRRLNLLYGDQHTLLINTQQQWQPGHKDHWFDVALQLKLSHA